MPESQFFNQLFTSLPLLKVSFLVGDAFYIIFALVILNQVISMTNIVSDIHSSAVLKIIAIINLIFALSLFLIALVIL